jgi:hypothetical protein
VVLGALLGALSEINPASGSMPLASGTPQPTSKPFLIVCRILIIFAAELLLKWFRILDLDVIIL